MMTDEEILESRKDLMRFGMFGEDDVDKIFDCALEMTKQIHGDLTPALLSQTIAAVISISHTGVKITDEVWNGVKKNLLYMKGMNE